MCGKGLSKKTEQNNVVNGTLNHDASKSDIVANNAIGDVIDDEENGEELERLKDIMNAFTPERLQVRNLTKEAKAPKMSAKTQILGWLPLQ